MARQELREVKAAVLCAALLLVSAGPSGVVEIVVEGVRNAKGNVLVAICTEREFLSPRCDYAASARAAPGFVIVRITGVPAGTYAAQAYHDENDNRRIDRNFLGLPTEGMGFSNDARFRFGPPTFQDAAFRVGPEGGRITLRLRYLTG